MNHQDDLFAQRNTRADQIFNAFRAFHLANPEVWVLFEKFTLEVVRRGFSHYSSDTVFGRIRWHTEIDTGGGALKLNNNFSAYYSRLFHAKYPAHADFFLLRTRKSEERPASANDRQEFIDAPAGDEDDLIRRLRALLP